MTIINEVQKLGQQIWLDNLSRHLIRSGQLQEKITQGISGVTTNPAIFLKSLQNDASYQHEIKILQNQQLRPKDIFLKLAIKDVQDACDLFSAQYQDTHGEQGYVSIELDPAFSDDQHTSIQEALSLWETINRPNVMIKIPATDAGITALEVLVSQGINVNMTLIFSQKTVQKIYQAYLQGLRNRLANDQVINCIKVVASFFISRIDAALDSKLPENLQGQVALSIAKNAYQDWEHFVVLNDDAQLKNHQIMPVNLLWASTGTKNPHYSDVMYVDNLIMPQTINTVPEATLQFFLDHGEVKNILSQQEQEYAEQVLKDVSGYGIDINELANQLQEEGLKQFEVAYAQILDFLAY